MANFEHGQIKLQYFAALAEKLGMREEVIILPKAEMSIRELKNFLALRIGPWRAINDQQIRCAINQNYAKEQDPVSKGDEVAFFPPVTGG